MYRLSENNGVFWPKQELLTIAAPGAVYVKKKTLSGKWGQQFLNGTATKKRSMAKERKTAPTPKKNDTGEKSKWGKKGNLDPPFSERMNARKKKKQKKNHSI